MGKRTGAKSAYKRRDPGKQKRAPRANLLTAVQIQEQLGISSSTFERMVRSGLQAAVPGVGSRPALYDAISVARCRIDRTPAEEPEEWMGGGDNSPWLEEYRKERARGEKFKNDHIQKIIMYVSEVHVLLDSVFDGLRAEFSAEERLLGPESVDRLRAAILRAQEKSLTLLPARPVDDVADTQKRLL
jgi:hypothetical protein